MSALLRRREMMVSAKAEEPALYPLINGTHLFTADGDGRYITVTDGCRITLSSPAYNTRGANVSDITVNGTSSKNNAAAYRNQPEKFTIPAGSEVVLSVKLISRTDAYAFSLMLMPTTGTAAYTGFSVNLPTTAGETATITATATADMPVGCLAVNWTSRITADFVVSLYVDGVRYI